MSKGYQFDVRVQMRTQVWQKYLFGRAFTAEGPLTFVGGLLLYLCLCGFGEMLLNGNPAITLMSKINWQDLLGDIIVIIL